MGIGCSSGQDKGERGSETSLALLANLTLDHFAAYPINLDD